MLPPLTTPRALFITTSSRDCNLSTGTKRKSPDQPESSKKSKATYCRDLFESKPLGFGCSTPIKDTTNVFAQVIFIASGNSPDIKQVAVCTSSPIKKPPIEMSTPKKREKQSPRSRPGRGKKLSPIQSNTLRSYFKASPKKAEHRVELFPEVIDISDDSDTDALAVGLPAVKQELGVLVLSDDSDTDSLVVGLPAVAADSGVIVLSDDSDIEGVALLRPQALRVQSDIIVVSDDSDIEGVAAMPPAVKVESGVAASGNNITDPVLPSFGIEATYDDSSSDYSESQLDILRTLVKKDEAESNSRCPSDITPSPYVVKVEQVAAVLDVVGQNKESVVTPLLEEVLVPVQDAKDYSDPADFVHQGIPGCLGASEGPEDEGRISVPQLCHLYEKISDDSGEITIRLNVGYSEYLAENDTWVVEKHIDDAIETVMKHNHWHLALTECLNYVTKNTYLPSYILQHVMHNALNTHNSQLVCWSMMVLQKSLRFQPAYAHSMSTHYTALLTATYLTRPLYPSCNAAILDQLLELLSRLCNQLNCGEDDDTEDEDILASSADHHDRIDAYTKVSNAKDVGRNLELVDVYATLRWSEKLHRICSLLDLVITILEQDIVKCSKEEGVPIVSQIFWPNQAQRNVGVANPKCRVVFNLLRQTLKLTVNKYLVRLVSVLAEAVLLSERSSNSTSKQTSPKCLEFARSIFLAAKATSGCDLTLVTVRLKPYWLRSQVVQLATSISGLHKVR